MFMHLFYIITSCILKFTCTTMFFNYTCFQNQNIYAIWHAPTDSIIPSSDSRLQEFLLIPIAPPATFIWVLFWSLSWSIAEKTQAKFFSLQSFSLWTQHNYQDDTSAVKSCHIRGLVSVVSNEWVWSKTKRPNISELAGSAVVS